MTLTGQGQALEIMDVEKDSEKIIEAALNAQIATGCPGAILEISAPRFGFTFSIAQGLYSRNGSRPLRADDAFRAASVTKAVTAALIVHLAANQYWDLDDSIAGYLSKQVVGNLRRLKGLSDVNEITIRRLLGHTSGLPDYFFDSRFQALVKKDPNRLWQPEQLVQAATENGKILFPPGTDFYYGDTAYVVVGLAVEGLLGCCLADAYRTHIFNPLEMGATYLEWHDASQIGDISHHYDGDEDLQGRNLSFDWAGGGLVTTAADLARFLRGLFGKALFSRQWLSELTDWRTQTRWRPHSSARYLRYGLGLGTNMAYGEEIIGVTGVWGGFAYYWPAGDATITGTLNLVGADRPALMDEIIRALQQLKSVVHDQADKSSA